MKRHITAALQEARTTLDQFLKNEYSLMQIERSAMEIITAITKENRIFSCGNGGSMCDAMHFAEELSGRFRGNRRPFPAVAISDPGHITCVANDFGFQEVFSRYLEGFARQGDILLAISTSGESPSILRAAEVARMRGLKTIALTGRENSSLSALADICICTPGGSFADRAQEMHIKVLHILIEVIERHFVPEAYLAQVEGLK